ncbi:hypothetical protein DM02DRAFT_317529 [Periconia macrospinosa]|uniref:Uncharacterized protein n=1 Tax=Periconia macrospinosa TaxID=97972 RepID=A0A2V1DV06_9PLEO|nr:hypothetical protein DM02DRAFT_317529 [Periconia macrospinosa]
MFAPSRFQKKFGLRYHSSSLAFQFLIFLPRRLIIEEVSMERFSGNIEGKTKSARMLQMRNGRGTHDVLCIPAHTYHCVQTHVHYRSNIKESWCHDIPEKARNSFTQSSVWSEWIYLKKKATQGEIHRPWARDSKRLLDGRVSVWIDWLG